MRRLLRATIAAVLAVGSLLAGSHLLRQLLPLPPIYVARAKYQQWDRQADRYTTIFIGSSRVYRGVAPEVFDRTLEERGIESTSFNFAMPGMRIAERVYLLDRVLERRPAKLDWVVLEFDTLHRVEPENRDTPRVVYWHDLPTTLLATRMAAKIARQEGVSALETARRLRDDVVPFLLRTLNVGRLHRALVEGPSALAAERDEVFELGRRGDGYVSLEEMGTARARRRRFRQSLDLHRRRVARLARTPDETSIDPFALRLARELEARAERSGTRIAFLLPPDIRRLTTIESTLRSAPELVVFSFQDPKRYPDLFAARMRYDEGHLNEAGAELLSRLLGERIAEATGGGGG